ncbi:venom prothrombin activator omicarin-C non-catalytic subunit-like, partial [Actinia tenebrosa]|uniref:Venom prothrombin activator omicarin-C non-catalytic subunit-like n=1 Tax=Actinia tenebrosa TaxID=6105 RepID=A0A6P8HTY5_ACTTE
WGNFDRSTVVREVLFNITVLRYIRIIPKTHQTTPCLRTEIYGYQVNQTCSSHSLGIPSPKRVLNHRISATSYYNNEHHPYMGRLGSDSAWGPEKQKGYDYLQIDVGAVSYICSIASQGNGDNELYEWVTKYEVLYSTTNNQYITYSENGTDKVKCIFFMY